VRDEIFRDYEIICDTFEYYAACSGGLQVKPANATTIMIISYMLVLTRSLTHSLIYEQVKLNAYNDMLNECDIPGKYCQHV
jgi:hypothetical protein